MGSKDTYSYDWLQEESLKNVCLCCESSVTWLIMRTDKWRHILMDTSHGNILPTQTLDSARLGKDAMMKHHWRQQPWLHSIPQQLMLEVDCLTNVRSRLFLSCFFGFKVTIACNGALSISDLLGSHMRSQCEKKCHIWMHHHALVWPFWN